MILRVDKKKCIGCGACAALCPDVFELKDGKSIVKNMKGCASCDCQQAADSCPVQAITFKK